MKIIDNTLNKYQRLTVFFFVLISIMSCLQFYTSGILEQSYRICRYLPIIWSALCFPILIRKKYGKYNFILLADFALILIITMISIIFEYSGNLTYMAIGIYILLAIQLENLITEKVLFSCFRMMTIVGVCMFIFFFLVEGYDLSMIIGKAWSGYVWSKSFYFVSILWFVPYYVILAHIKNQDKLLSSIIWVVYVLWNLMFLKRFVFVDSLLMAVILIYHYNKINKVNANTLLKFLFAIICIVVVVYFVLGNSIIPLIISILSRFTRSMTDLSSFDRVVEFSTYLKSSNWYEVIIGGGFVHRFVYLDGLIRYNLHIGWGDLIYHGGIILFIIYLFPHFKIPLYMKNYNKLSDLQKICLGYVLLNALKYLYTGPYVFYPQMLITFFSILVISKRLCISAK